MLALRGCAGSGSVFPHDLHERGVQEKSEGRGQRLRLFLQPIPMTGMMAHKHTTTTLASQKLQRDAYRSPQALGPRGHFSL